MTVQAFGDICVRDLGVDGATISYPKNAERTADLKATFPKARWAPVTRVWGIPGKLGFKRACLWAERISAADRPMDRQRIIDAAAFDGRTSRYVKLGEVESIVTTPYDEMIATICRRIGGAFDRYHRVWRIPGSSLRALIEALPQIDELATAASAREAQRKAEIEAERAAQREAEDARRAQVRASRVLVLSSQAPRPGATIRRLGRALVVESLGREFRADENTSSIGGPIGAEGESVRYAYCREATADEEAALLAREEEIARGEAVMQSRSQAVRTVAASTDAPQIGDAPEGEVIWRDDSSGPTGYRRWIVLTPDGWLWYLTYDGTDGGAWGMFNCGYNTMGVRSPAIPELIAALRAN